MDLRLAVYQLASSNQLDAAQTRQLQELAGFEHEPEGLSWWLPRGVAVLGAALLGLGLIFWVAANWAEFSRTGRFALIQAIFVASCLGACVAPRARAPLLLIAMLAIGGLFAYFGQTYQTGADPWQLFAVWAALALPLCLVARSDVLWTPWMLVLATGVTLWIKAHAQRSWSIHSEDLGIFFTGWLALLLACAFVSPLLARWTGAKAWPLRLGLLLTMIMVTGSGMTALFNSTIATPYWAGLVLLLAVAALLLMPHFFDVFGLSAVALGINTLIISGMVSRLFSGNDGDEIASLLMIGLVAAVLLALTVQGILWRTRRELA